MRLLSKLIERLKTGLSVQPQQDVTRTILVMKNSSSIPKWIRKGEPHFMEQLQELSDQTLGLIRFLRKFGITPRQLMEAVPGFLISDQSERGLDSPEWEGFSGTFPTKREFTDSVIQAIANLTRCRIELYEYNWLNGDDRPRYYGSFNPE